MSKSEVIMRFENVSFGYGHNKPILSEASFTVRNGSKITLMGQNGAGKSTIFQLITGAMKPDDGRVIVANGMTIATARQVIPRDQMSLSVAEFFAKAFNKKIYDIDPKIDKVLDAVNLRAPKDRAVKSFSGGQQARLLLAYALIQNPDLLLLDEPTNNLDKDGVEHLRNFLIEYKKTVIVISHDSEFLNSFTEGVLYLDIFMRKVEQYVGNYFDVVKEISARIERERAKNARLAADIQNRKEQMNFFAQKGGHMRAVARKMREKIEELEEEKVELRDEDRTIRRFAIPFQDGLEGQIAVIKSIPVIKRAAGKKRANSGKSTDAERRKVNIVLTAKIKLLIAGPNGIGKTSFLESMASGTAKDVEIQPNVRIGYYRQDFSTLNFEDTVYKSLVDAAERATEEEIRSVAAGFLLNAEILKTRIGSLSEGQKGLVSFARLVLQRPGLLILDEPTNHINFRHIPIIAEALDKYAGPMILVSHVKDFVDKISINEVADLEKI